MNKKISIYSTLLAIFIVSSSALAGPIYFGNISDSHISEAFDPPMDFFRVRLVINAFEGLVDAGRQKFGVRSVKPTTRDRFASGPRRWSR